MISCVDNETGFGICQLTVYHLPQLEFVSGGALVGTGAGVIAVEGAKVDVGS